MNGSVAAMVGRHGLSGFVRRIGRFGHLGRFSLTGHRGDGDAGDAALMDAKGQGGAFRQIDAAHAMRRLAVIHLDHHGAAAGLIGDPHHGAKPQAAVGGGHAGGIEALAAGGDVVGVLTVIPGGLADLDDPFGGWVADGSDQAGAGDRAGICCERAGKRVGDQSRFDEHFSSLPKPSAGSARIT